MHMTNVNTYTWSLTQFVIFVFSLFVPFIVNCIATEILMYCPMSITLHVLCVSDRYFLFTTFVPYRRELEQHVKGSPYGLQPNRVAAQSAEPTAWSPFIIHICCIVDPFITPGHVCSTSFRDFVVTSNENHRIIHLFKIIEILNKFKIFHYFF